MADLDPHLQAPARLKLATVLTNGRHFALEQAARGIAIEMLVAHGSYADTLGLPIAIQLREVSILPAGILTDSDSALGNDQRHGIDDSTAQRLAETVLH